MSLSPQILHSPSHCPLAHCPVPYCRINHISLIYIVSSWRTGWSLFCPHTAQFSSVQLLSRVQVFATPWTAACWASLTLWQPTPVFLPGESNGQRSQASYSLWDLKSQTQLSDQRHTAHSVVLCRECHYSFECMCVQVQINNGNISPLF